MISYEAMAYQTLFEIQSDFNRLAETVNNGLIPLYINESYGSYIETTITDIDSYIRGVRKKLKELEHSFLLSMMSDVDKCRELISKLDIEMGKRDIDLNKTMEYKNYKINNNVAAMHNNNFNYIKQRIGSMNNIKFDSEGNIVSERVSKGISDFSEIFTELKKYIDNTISGKEDNFESSCKERFIDGNTVSVKEELDFIRSNRYKNTLSSAIKEVNIICSNYLREVKNVIKTLRNGTNNYSDKNRYDVLKIVSNYNQLFKYEISRFIQYIGYMFDAAKSKNAQARELIGKLIQGSDVKEAVKESYALNYDDYIDNTEIVFV